jgi:hypothetical protein
MKAEEGVNSRQSIGAVGILKVGTNARLSASWGQFEKWPSPAEKRSRRQYSVSAFGPNQIESPRCLQRSPSPSVHRDLLPSELNLGILHTASPRPPRSPFHPNDATHRAPKPGRLGWVVDIGLGHVQCSAVESTGVYVLLSLRRSADGLRGPHTWRSFGDGSGRVGHFLLLIASL